MSIKRSASEGNPLGKRTADMSDEEEKVKKTVMIALSGTTLQDLPNEVLEKILIETVVMEVKSLKLAKNVWKDKSKVILHRLQAVCTLWSSIINQDYFQSQVQQALEFGEQVQLEIVSKDWMKQVIFSVTSMNDDVFILYKSATGTHKEMYVHEHNHLNRVKEIVPLSDLSPVTITASKSINSVFILDKRGKHNKVFRVRKDRGGDYNISSWISNSCLENAHVTMSVTPEGNVILAKLSDGSNFGSQQVPGSPEIFVYDAHSFLKHHIFLPEDVFELHTVIPKLNGNYVVVARNQSLLTRLIEVSKIGRIIRQHQSQLTGCGCNLVDKYGRLLITTRLNKMELLDDEMNFVASNNPSNLDPGKGFDGLSLEFHHLKKVENWFLLELSHADNVLHYDNERDEVYWLKYDSAANRPLLMVVRFK